MKTLIQYIILLSILSCTNNSDNGKTNYVTEKVSEFPIPEKPIKKIDSVDFCQDRYLLVYEGYKAKCVMTLSHDTIFKPNDYYSHFFFEDFNSDGCADFVFELEPRYCGLFEVFQYDKNKKRFDQISGILPNQWRLENTEFFLSYERLKDSCYKSKSYLSKINKLKNIKLAAVYFNNCEAKERIELYAVDKQGKETFAEELPLSDLIRLQGDEQSYLRKYWLTHLPTENKSEK